MNAARWSTILAMLAAVACGEGDGGDPTSATTATTGAGATSSSSGLTCPEGYGECDGDAATLCETSLEIDVEHCGSCDKPCQLAGENQTDRCVAGVCVPSCVVPFVDCDGDPANGCETTSSRCGVVTLADVDSPTGLAVADGYVWFGSRGHEAALYADGYVARVPTAGGDVEIVAEGQPRPLNMSVGGEFVAWSRFDDLDRVGSIHVMPRGGGPVVQLATGVPVPNNPVIVGDVVWFGAGDGTLRRAPIDGSSGDGGGEVVATLGSLTDLVEDGGYLYWSDAGAPGSDEHGQPTVVRYRISDGERVTLTSGISAPSWHIALGAEYLFVGSRAGSLWRIHRWTGASALVAEGLVASPQEVVLDEIRGRVYATSGGTTVMAFSSTSVPSAAEVLVADQAYTTYLAQDEDALYWIDGRLSSDGGAVRKAPK